MSDTHEVISAFLDDEPFDPLELANVLSEPSGRALLIDLVALRHIVQPNDAIPAGMVAMLRPRRSAMRAFMAAAAVFVALIGGYLAGQSRSVLTGAEAPAPTRVVQALTAWQDLLPGRSTQ